MGSSTTFKVLITFISSGSDTHHTLSSQEVRDDLLVDVVHQTSRTLVVVAGVDEELLAGVFIDERTHLRSQGGKKTKVTCDLTDCF